MTNPEIIGGIGRIGLIHPGAADFAAFGGHQPFGPGFSRRSPLRHYVTVCKNSIDFRVSSMRWPSRRLIDLIIGIYPMKTERLQTIFCTISICGFRNHQRS